MNVVFNYRDKKAKYFQDNLPKYQCVETLGVGDYFGEQIINNLAPSTKLFIGAEPLHVISISRKTWHMTDSKRKSS